MDYQTGDLVEVWKPSHAKKGDSWAKGLVLSRNAERYYDFHKEEWAVQHVLKIMFENSLVDDVYLDNPEDSNHIHMIQRRVLDG